MYQYSGGIQVVYRSNAMVEKAVHRLPKLGRREECRMLPLECFWHRTNSLSMVSRIFVESSNCQMNEDGRYLMTILNSDTRDRV